MWRCALGLFFLVPIAAAAQSRSTEPCAVSLTPKVRCALPPGASDIVAMLDNTPIRFGDLDDATRKTIEGLDVAIAKARTNAAGEAADDLLLEREAKRRGVSVGDLLYAEVMRKTARPTEEEVANEMAAHPDVYKSKEYAEWAAANIFDGRLAARERDFIGVLETRFPAKANPAADRYVELAAADVRLDALKEQKAAVDGVVQMRLVAAEAARRGVTAEELVRSEKARIAAGEEWEREIAFDAQMRRGHSIRYLFEIPKRPAVKIDVKGVPAEGPKDAKVTLVEWGDFECPPCGRMSHVVDQALKPVEGKVRYVFLQFPMTAHAYAWKAAEAALAAHAQGKFFPYARKLFANQKSLDVASLKKYASEVGLDQKKFDKDLDSGRFAGEVLIEQRRGKRAGVIGTPTFFINGVRGGDDVYSLEGMRVAIAAAVKAH